jgi:hypothetical protein
MKSACSFLGYLLLLLSWGECCFAQNGPHWPRNATFHSVELSGILPWPTQARTALQRRALVRHWYWTKLTDEKAAEESAMSSQEATTYSGVPAVGYFDQRPHSDEVWRLLYRLRLTPTTTGLSYCLSNFEYAYGVEDTSGGGTLEELLMRPPAEQPELAIFHKRLLAALATW